jgi:hypothetical protein
MFMKKLETEMCLYTLKGTSKRKMAIKRGIFHGDWLSPLLVCLALIPLTNILNKQGAGYDVKGINKICHLFYRMT